MKKILALAGSNSSKSINFQLVKFVAGLMEEYEVTVLNISKWVIPIYSEDMDADNFTPEEILTLIDMVKGYNGFIIASPEHNGGPTVFFKNITDWLSRRADKVLEDKPVLLLSTSPGRRGALSSRTYYEVNLSRIGGKVSGSFGLPSFQQNLVEGVMAQAELAQLKEEIKEFNGAFEL